MLFRSEAVVGDLRDEFDTAEREPSVRRREDGSYDIDGGVPLATVNDVLGARFEREAVETIGGLVLDHLGRVPEAGDSIEVSGYAIEVEAVDGTRISRVRVQEHDESGEDTPEA